MTVRELYTFLSEKIPPALSCDWDNDGLMVCPDETREVKRVLVALDADATVMERAVSGHYDVIVTHHPLIFHPLASVSDTDAIGARVLRAVRSAIAVMSFHTRLDVVPGGVNDCLAEALGLTEVIPLCDDGLGRVGTLPAAVSLADFTKNFRRVTGAPVTETADAGKPVHRVALLGGSGGDEIGAAIRRGADTYLTGEVRYNDYAEAREAGVNLVVGGHYFTENVVCDRLQAWIREISGELTVDTVQSCPISFF